jgi:hypothetical protein
MWFKYFKLKIITQMSLCLTLREEHRRRVFENRVLRRIFGPKRDEVTGELKKLHNEELHNLYSSPNIIRQIKSRRMMWAGHVARMGEERKVYRALVRNPEGKRPLGRPRRRLEDGIRMDLKETGWGSIEWIQLAQDRDRWRALVNTVLNLRVLAPQSYLVICHFVFILRYMLIVLTLLSFLFRRYLVRNLRMQRLLRGFCELTW